MKLGANGQVNAVETQAITNQASLWKSFLLLFIFLKWQYPRLAYYFYQRATRDMYTLDYLKALILEEKHSLFIMSV